MESIIIFSGSSLICFFVLALFSKGNLSLPQSRVLRSLGRTTSAKENELGDKAKSSGKGNPLSFLHRLSSAFAKKSKETNDINRELTAAGLRGWTWAEWKVLHYVPAFCCALAAAVTGFTLPLPPLAKIIIILIGFIIGYISPNFWLKSKVKQRNGEILRSLPEVLDLIMVSVEAGLGFDAAIMQVVEKQKGALADEFHIVLQEIKMGKPRRDALRDLAKRNSVEDLSNVIASLVQADQLGISMGSVLRNQSNQIRQKRKQRAQEQAQKAPVKIMIPLVFFIFPSIFIVILGPAFIKVIEVFSN